MDLRIAITRTAVFTVVYTLVLGVPLVSAWLWQEALRELFGQYWWIGLWAGSSALATVAHYLNMYFQRRAEERLLAKHRQRQGILRRAAQELPFIQERQPLLDRLSTLLIETAKAAFALLYLWNPKTKRYELLASWGKSSIQPQSFLEAEDPVVVVVGNFGGPLFLEEAMQKGNVAGGHWKTSGVAVLIPCLERNQPVAILALGETLSGQNYVQEDLEVFFILATQLGFALENLDYLEEIKAQQEQLRQSDRLATAGKLAASIAHEIKQPLTAIKAYVSLLPTRKQDSAFLDQFYTVVHKEVIRMEGTARQLTDFSRPKPLQKKKIDVTALLQETASFLRPECMKRRVELSHELSASLQVEADPDQIKQVLINLALNGLDAMDSSPEDCPRQLKLSAFPIQEGIALAVTDTGCGMDAQALEHLFEPFHTTKSAGTGLGLVVVKQIIENHSGKIQVASQPGVGTTFTIKLPAARE